MTISISVWATGFTNAIIDYNKHITTETPATGQQLFQNQ